MKIRFVLLILLCIVIVDDSDYYELIRILGNWQKIIGGRTQSRVLASLAWYLTWHVIIITKYIARLTSQNISYIDAGNEGCECDSPA